MIFRSELLEINDEQEKNTEWEKVRLGQGEALIYQV